MSMEQAFPRFERDMRPLFRSEQARSSVLVVRPGQT
jgi:hypothetical protein